MGATNAAWSSRQRRLIITLFATIALLVMPAGSAAAFEPPADPTGNFSCPGGQPVPGHPGFPGIATGAELSFANSGERAVAAWSAVFNNPTGTIALC